MIKKDYYTTIQAAKHLGVSVRTVQLWVENGSLEAWKTAGGHRRIVASSVDDYVHKNQNKTVKNTQKKRILIVEDNPTVCTFYSAAIKSWGLNFDVITKKDGFEGLMEIGRQAPDLLISDIYMPGMDGLQMIRSLYKSEQLNSEQIIIISGLSNNSITERGGIPAGIEHFSKPVDVESLKKAIIKKLGITLPNNTVVTPTT